MLMHIVFYCDCNIDLGDDDDDEEDDEEDKETTNKGDGSSFSVYSHTPEDLYLDPSGQMVFETNDTSGKEPGQRQGQGQGRIEEKVELSYVIVFWSFGIIQTERGTSFLLSSLSLFLLSKLIVFILHNLVLFYAYRFHYTHMHHAFHILSHTLSSSAVKQTKNNRH